MKPKTARDPDTGWEAIQLVCGATSPRLDHPGAEGVRFTCQKATHHSGAHAIALIWTADAEMFPTPPWMPEDEA